MKRLTEAWFEFNGINSRDMGVRLRQMPTRFLPARNVTRQVVADRHGAVPTGDGCYKDVQVRIECEVTDETKLSACLAWLCGDGLLRFSDEPTLAYDASVIREFSRTPIHSRGLGQRFTVVWTCDPLRRAYPEPAPIAIDSSGEALVNPGTAPSSPRITIRGSGSFSLTIGKQTMFFRDVTDGIIVDSELMDALNLEANQLANDKIEGDFITIAPGTNYVQWLEGGTDATGSVSLVIIEPRWRYL